MNNHCKILLLALPIGITMIFITLSFLELFAATEFDGEIKLILSWLLMLGAVQIAQRIFNRIVG